MPQIVEIEGVGELEFPDGMSHEEMRDAIYKNFPNLVPEEKQPGLIDRALSFISPARQEPQQRTLMDDPSRQGFGIDPIGPGVSQAIVARHVLDMAKQRAADKERGIGEVSSVRGADTDAVSVIKGLAQSPIQGAESARQGLRMQFGELIGSERMTRDALQRYEAAQMDIERTTPELTSSTAKGVYSGFASFLQQAPALAASIATGSAVPALASMFLQTETDAYGKYISRGADPTMALIGGIGEGTVEVVTELLPMKFLVDKLGKAGAGELLKGLLAREIPREQAATLAQDAIDTAIANPDKTWGDYLEERPSAAYQTLVATITQSGLATAVNSAAKRALETNAASREQLQFDRLADAIGHEIDKAIPDFSTGAPTVPESAQVVSAPERKSMKQLVEERIQARQQQMAADKAVAGAVYQPGDYEFAGQAMPEHGPVVFDIPEKKEPQTVGVGREESGAKVSQYGIGAERVEHITRKNKKLIGVVDMDMSLDDAKEIDPYAFRKNGGVFIRDQRIKEYNERAKVGGNDSLGERGAGAERAEQGRSGAVGELDDGERTGAGGRGVPSVTGKPIDDSREDIPLADAGRRDDDALERGTVGGKLSAGQVVTTNTGRKTSPFPAIDTSTERKTGNTVKRADKWLMQNAIEEAKSRGDEFNQRQFEHNLKNPSQSDKDSAEEYLFGDYIPPVVEKTIKQLASTDKEQAEVVPRDSWRGDLLKSREYAAKLRKAGKLGDVSDEAMSDAWKSADALASLIDYALLSDTQKKQRRDIEQRIKNANAEPGDESRQAKTKAVLGRIEKSLLPEDQKESLSRKLSTTTEEEVSVSTAGGIQYHGTSSRIERLRDDTWTSLNYYGQGFYTTDSLDIAKGYSRKGKGASPTIYQVTKKRELSLFDMEQPLSKEIMEILSGLESDIVDDSLASDAKNLREVYDEIRGESQNRFMSADDVQEIFDAIAASLSDRGYDGLSHIGGLRTKNRPHRVEIYFHPSQVISIESIEEGRKHEPTKLDQPSKKPLEGVPAEAVRESEEKRDTGAGAEAGGREDIVGGVGPGEYGVPSRRGVPDGEGRAPIPAGREQKPRSGVRGREDVPAGDEAKEQSAPAGTPARGDEEQVKALEESASEAKPAAGEATQRPEPAQSRPPKMFTITDDMGIGQGGPKTKFKNNVAAIQLLKALVSEGRQATPDEQAVLARFVGWGGLRNAFYRDDGSTAKGWEKEAEQLRGLLTEAEYRAAESSTKDAHYTSTEIVRAIWSAVKAMGFNGGEVLEPSVGSGNFLGMMPADIRSASNITAVELDNITGGIAKQLYPGANINAPLGFQDLSMPDGYFDLAIGNPPFGSQQLYDGKRKDIGNFSIHNYFFAKSIDGLRPGGLLAMVVSSRLMDTASNEYARHYMQSRVNFLGAIRLPNNAFLKNAGTEVTTDIIFMQKLEEGMPRVGPSFVKSVTINDKNGIEVPLNNYYLDRPEMMLGEWGAYGSMYGPNEPALVAREGQDTIQLLNQTISTLQKGIFTPRAKPVKKANVPRSTSVEGVKVGSMFISDGQVMVRMEDHLGQPVSEKVDLSGKKLERVVGLVSVRDALTDLRKAQLSDSATDSALKVLRAKLNKAYDDFVKSHGPINQYANKQVFIDDPSWPQVASLEESFDKGISPAIAKKTGEKPRRPSAQKADIFFKRTQSPYKAPQSAASAKDAMLASLSEKGRLDLDYMTKLYGKTSGYIIDELGDLVYESEPGVVVTADEYLSGNVRQKLAFAETLAASDRKFERNVEALRSVIPEDIDAIDIEVKPGAHWVPAKDIAQFVSHIMGNDSGRASYTSFNARWSISGTPSEAAKAKWGTSRVDVLDILVAASNQKQISVRDRIDENTTVLNEAATSAANEKVELIKAEFKRWIWKDDARRERLARFYNDTFNTDRRREYDGSHLSFPGIVDTIRLRIHQYNAVWRMLQSGATLLDHVVGAGKTFTMIAAAMEMRRIGKARKPMFVVPNHLVGQWAEDFVKLYPGANILATTKKDFEAKNRKRLFARIATGDWDAVIVAHSSFGRVEMDKEFQAKFIQQQIEDIETAIRASRESEGKSSRNIKQIADQRDRLKEKLKKLFDAANKDDNLTFGELGVDALFVDEAHEFKNLGFASSMTRVAGLGDAKGSQKAADLFMKTQFIMEKTGGNNVVFATGTPISNSMVEMYTIQRYLDYATLKQQGLAHFDAWSKMFGEVVTDWELSPSGKYKLNTRLSKFVNLPELMQRYTSFGDVINRDDINRQLASVGKKLPVPKVKGGKPKNIVVDRSKDQAVYIGEPVVSDNGVETYPKGSLVWRAENLPKKAEKGGDNMLNIMMDARKAALDMRLISPSYGDNKGSKINVAADNIMATYDKWSGDKGTQLVFIDLSTPNRVKQREAAKIRELIKLAEDGDESAQESLDNMSPDDLAALDGNFSVYDDLRQKLIDRGIPAVEIAFIQDASTEIQKEELFGKVRSGRVRVLLGSTKTMGAGMNVQERLVALHHMDAPWRPSDLEQREGRIIRQGNVLYERDPDGFEVEILRYATKQTLDSRMWQTIETKAKFIDQVRKGDISSREVEDIAGEASNAAEMKAASSGNPLILEEMDLKQKVRKLEQLESEHSREQFRIRDQIRQLKLYVEKGKSKLLKLASDSSKAKKAPKQFIMTVSGSMYDSHKEAGLAILSIGNAMAEAGHESKPVGEYAGFKLRLDNISGSSFVVTIQGEREYQVDIEDISKSDPTGLATRIQNTVKRIPSEYESSAESMKMAEADIPELEKQVEDWPKAEELIQARSRHAIVIAKLRPKSKEQIEVGQGGVSAMVSPAKAGDQPMPNWVPPYEAKGAVPDRPQSDVVTVAGIAVKLEPEDKPTRREGIRVMLMSIIGPRLYEGKIKGRSKLGFYRKSNSEVRIKRYGDVEVMAHEMAHYLDMHYQFKGRFTQAYKSAEYRDEVAGMSYTSDDKAKVKEGFAEFVRLWLTNYSEAKLAAPKFISEFERVLNQDKMLNDKMIALRNEMHKWYLQGVRAQSLAMMTGTKYTPSQFAAKVLLQRPLEIQRQKYVDHIHAAKIMERTRHGELLSAEESAYKQLQLLNGSEGIIYQSYYNGAPYFKNDGEIGYRGPSLNDVWGKSVKAGLSMLRKQEAYFVARRMRELKLRGIDTQFTEQHIRDGLALGVEFPHFKQLFDLYQKYNENMFKFYVETGYISAETAKKITEKNKNYVPAMRDIDPVSGGSPGRSGGGFKRIKGSTRNLRPVMDTIMVESAKHIQSALVARAKRKLYMDQLNSQDGSLFIAKLSPDSKPGDRSIIQSVIESYTETLEKAVVEDGVIITDANGNEITPQELRESSGIDSMMFFSHGHRPKTTETMVDSFIDDRGKTVWVEIQHDAKIVADMIDSLSPYHLSLPDGALGIILKAAVRAKQLVTLTITSAYQFVGANVVRDQQQAFVLSGGKYKPGWDMLKGMKELIASLFDKNSVYHQMVAQGGPRGGRVRAQFEESYDRGMRSVDMLPLYYPTKFMNALLDSYIAIMDSFEVSTRIGFYMRMLNEGKSPREAAWQAREISTDFSKHGSYAPFVIFQRTIPFFGAYMQSIDRDLRAYAELRGEMKFSNLVKTESGRAKLTDLKVRIWIASSIMISVPIILALMNDDEEEYQDLTDDQKTRFYHFWVDGEHYTIPKPHGLVSAMGQAGEAIVDHVRDNATSKEAADTMLFALAYHFGFNSGPALTQPWYELAKNEDWRGAPIVPTRLQSVSPEFQFSDRTPLLYVNLGKELGISPLKAEHVVDGYLGYFSDYIAEWSEVMLWDDKEWGERPFRRDTVYLATKSFKPMPVPYRTKWTEGYYELNRRANEAKANLDILSGGAIRDSARLEEFVVDDLNATLIGMDQVFADIDRSLKDQNAIIASYKYDPSLTAEEKEKEIEAWYEMKNSTLKTLYRQVEDALSEVESKINK